jgi:hypothetical protein
MEKNWYRTAESTGFNKIAQPIPGVAQANPLVNPATTPPPQTTTNISDIMKSLMGHRSDFFKVVAQLLGMPNANPNSLLPVVQKNLMAITSQMPMMDSLLKTLNVDPQKLTPNGLQIMGANLSQMCGTNPTQAANIMLSLIGENAMSFETKAQQNYGALGGNPATSATQQVIQRTVQRGV